MKDDREFSLIKNNKFARILRALDILWLILFVILFGVRENFGLKENYIIGLGILIASLYSLGFLYFKGISFTQPPSPKGRPQFFQYYTQYKKTPLTEIIIWLLAIFFSLAIIFLL